MGSDNEEPDYMSDIFVSTSSDVKPGLVTARSVQRSRTTEILSKSNRTLPKAVQEAQRLREGLQKQVGPENKGFAMLAKMGYVQGKGLGKNAEGRAEPVPIEIPSERKGLGFSKAEQERLRARVMLKNMQQIMIQNDFRNTMATRFRFNQLNRQLKAARHICQRLDLEKLIDVPVNLLFWPVEETDTEVPRPVKIVPVKRKRKSHHHHHHHEIKRPAIPDMDRTDEFVQDDDDFPESEDEDFADFDEADPATDISSLKILLDDLLDYLRGRHHYCFWCSHQYESRSELLAECPGLTEDEHG